MSFIKFDEATLRDMLSAAVDQNVLPIYLTDNEGTILYVNEAFSAMSGYSPEELLGNNASIMKSGSLPPGYYKAMWEELLSGKPWKGEFPNRTKSGDLYWESSIISPVKNRSGDIVHFVAVMQDITQLKSEREVLETRASTDPLTSDINRRAGLQLLETQLAAAAQSGTELAIAFLDINGMKSVNDQLGHNKGDELLRGFSQFIKSRIRESDTLCRMGGDEFLVIFPSCTAGRAHKLLARIRNSYVHASDLVASGEGFSFGVAQTLSGKTLSAEQLISLADKRMYDNKRTFHKTEKP